MLSKQELKWHIQFLYMVQER